MEVKPTIIRAFKALVTGYIILSLFYSAHHLFSVYRGSSTPAAPSASLSTKASIDIYSSLKKGQYGPQRVKWTNPEGN
jgi:hypothetical protein